MLDNEDDKLSWYDRQPYRFFEAVWNGIVDVIDDYALYILGATNTILLTLLLLK